MDNVKEEIEKILTRYGTWEQLVNVGVDKDGGLRIEEGEGYDAFESCTEALSSYIKEREREAYNYGVVVGGGVESDEIWWVCDKGGHKVQLKDNVQNILSDEVKARCPICNGILYKTKPHETPKDRFKTVWNTNTFNGDVETDSDEIWNYHTTELKAVLESLRTASNGESIMTIRNRMKYGDYVDGVKYSALDNIVENLNQKIDKILKEYE